MEPLLVIMAAGLGSRFGGVKQLARVGPSDEAFLDFSIKDALAAGFGDVALIVRTDIEDDVRAHLAGQHPGRDFLLARQDELGPLRDKPWGTLHAVLSASALLDRPFAVINADDYYGPESFVLARQQIDLLGVGEGANVAFEMGKTVPPRGSVTRALTTVDDGRLTGIVETDGCERLDDGRLIAAGEPVAEDTPVSMNLWCFRDDVLPDFDERWAAFLAENADEPKAEFQLPTVVGELIDAGRLSVRVVSSPERWIGITNPEDLKLARAALADRGGTD
ncbi:MAG: NTP transferase domain-containing protein [Actinomycetota bacterium]